MEVLPKRLIIGFAPALLTDPTAHLARDTAKRLRQIPAAQPLVFDTEKHHRFQHPVWHERLLAVWQGPTRNSANSGGRGTYILTSRNTWETEPVGKRGLRTLLQRRTVE